MLRVMVNGAITKNRGRTLKQIRKSSIQRAKIWLDPKLMVALILLGVTLIVLKGNKHSSNKSELAVENSEPAISKQLIESTAQKLQVVQKKHNTNLQTFLTEKLHLNKVQLVKFQNTLEQFKTRHITVANSPQIPTENKRKIYASLSMQQEHVLRKMLGPANYRKYGAFKEQSLREYQTILLPNPNSQNRGS